MTCPAWTCQDQDDGGPAMIFDALLFPPISSHPTLATAQKATHVLVYFLSSFFQIPFRSAQDSFDGQESFDAPGEVSRTPRIFPEIGASMPTPILALCSKTAADPSWTVQLGHVEIQCIGRCVFNLHDQCTGRSGSLSSAQ